VQRYVAGVMAVCAFAVTIPAGAATWSQTEPASEPALRLRAAGGSLPEGLEKNLDFSNRNDSAIMEGTVQKGIPHRYIIAANKGQSLTAKLVSKEGARFDLYEPGSSLTSLSGGYVVQGARVGKQADGANLKATLPFEGKYLLLVRPEGDQAFYTLELGIRQSGSFALQDLWSERNLWIGAASLGALFASIMFFRRKRHRRIFRPD
jgi:hypothetical protein